MFETDDNSKSTYFAFPLQNECILIVEDFVRNPLTLYFRTPYDNPDYLSRIHHPMDLSTIHGKLIENEYPNFQAWAQDMNLIFDNAIEYHGEGSLIGGIAKFLRKKFQKYLTSLESLNIRNFEKQLIDLTIELQNLMNNPPLEDIIISTPSNEEINNLQVFSSQRLNTLLTNLKKKVENKGSNELIDILKYYQGNFVVDSQNQLDLAPLSHHTLLILEKYCSTPNDVNFLNEITSNNNTINNEKSDFKNFQVSEE